MRLKQLVAAGLSLAMSASGVPAQGGPKIVLGDNQGHTSGPYAAYLAPFNKDRLVYGKDYLQHITLDVQSFPDATIMSSRWPTRRAPKGIYNFVSLSFGDYFNTRVPKPITPMKIININELKQKHRMSFSGDLAGYDVITDFFLTGAPGSHNPHLFEIEFFLHTPPSAVAYVRASKQVGKISHGGVTWTVALAKGEATIILLMPADRRDIAVGQIDIRAILLLLVQKKLLTGGEYFNGLAMGMETISGAGRVQVDRFSVSYS